MSQRITIDNSLINDSCTLGAMQCSSLYLINELRTEVYEQCQSDKLLIQGFCFDRFCEIDVAFME